MIYYYYNLSQDQQLAYRCNLSQDQQNLYLYLLWLGQLFVHESHYFVRPLYVVYIDLGGAEASGISALWQNLRQSLGLVLIQNTASRERFSQQSRLILPNTSILLLCYLL